ncbi:MAG TPA: metalloregulator ArsR/SmtB family transcription factor [Acidimicrobiales bacterium]
MDAALRAIAEPHRREILRLVADNELAAGEIASHFELSRPAVSQHLRVLVEAGLLESRRDATRIIYSARPEGLDELREYLEVFWSTGLRRLKRAVEQEMQEMEDSDRAHRR